MKSNTLILKYHRITKYSVQQGTYKDHRIHLLSHIFCKKPPPLFKLKLTKKVIYCDIHFSAYHLQHAGQPLEEACAEVVFLSWVYKTGIDICSDIANIIVRLTMSRLFFCGQRYRKSLKNAMISNLDSICNTSKIAREGDSADRLRGCTHSALEKNYPSFLLRVHG